MIFIVLTCLAASAAARPSFIAVPADQIAFVDLSRIHVRVPRQTLSPPPPPPPLPQGLYDEDYVPIGQQEIPIQYQQQPIALAPPPQPQVHLPQHQVQALLRQQPQEAISAATQGQSARISERPPDFGEYVDFGAHTGDNGAFGWYADYPINQYQNDHSSYKK